MPSKVSHSGSLHCAKLRWPILEFGLLDPDPDPDPCGMLNEGRVAIVWMGCVPIWPDPTITWIPIDGTPLTTTKRKAGPGGKMAGFGGI